jgi:hypothetical protein
MNYTLALTGTVTTAAAPYRYTVEDTISLICIPITCFDTPESITVEGTAPPD